MQKPTAETDMLHTFEVGCKGATKAAICSQLEECINSHLIKPFSTCSCPLCCVALDFSHSLPVQLSLAMLLLGVGGATISDLQLNNIGAFISAAAVLTTSLAQIVTRPLPCPLKMQPSFRQCS